MDNEKENEIKEIIKDLKEVSAINAVCNTEGGQILIKSLVSDLISSLYTLCDSYTKLSLPEFIGIGATLKSNRDLLEVLIKSEGNKKYLDDLLAKKLKDAE